MDITEDNEGTVAVLVDYLTSKPNATVDVVKSGTDILEKLVDDASNLSNVCKTSNNKNHNYDFFTQNDALFDFFLFCVLKTAFG